jgi:hypothetical protein
MTPALLALLLPLSLTALGCGGSNDPEPPPVPSPALGTEAGIADLKISGAALQPPFSAGVNKYAATVGHLGEPTVGVTVTLKDPRATFRVNGLAGTSGAAAHIALREGESVINVAVTAEDGRTSNVVTLAISKFAPNTRVWVLNSIAGAPVENTKLTLTDSRGRVLAEDVPLPRAKNGTKVFGLDPGERYNIYAKGDHTAAACFAGFDPSREDTAALYCLRNYTTAHQFEPPVIEEIEFGAQNTNAGGPGGWRVMPAGAHYVGPAAGIAAMRVTVLTRNLIAGSTEASAVSNASVPVRVNIDEVASGNTGGATGVAATVVSRNEPAAGGYYRSVLRCAVPLVSTSIFNKEHFASIVAYDWLGDRTEQRVYLTITDSAADLSTDLDLAGTAPTWGIVQGQTFMGGGDMAVSPGPGSETNAMDPTPGPLTGYQHVTTQFYVRAPGTGTNLPIRGFEVWRSLGAADSFVKISTVNYAVPTTGDPFTYLDRTPSLVAGDAHYRVRAFSGNPANNGYSLLSNSVRARVLPPTITGQAASHEAVSGRLWPTFRIAASNPLMLNEDTSDTFFFTLFIKHADSVTPFLLVPMALRFSESQALSDYAAGTPEQGHRFGFPRGGPTAMVRQVTGWYASAPFVEGPWRYASDYDEGTGEYTPYVYLGGDGAVVVDTDSDGFRRAMDNAVRAGWAGGTSAEFVAGAAYVWNIYGNSGGIPWNGGSPLRWESLAPTNAAYFAKDFNADGATFLGCSFGSTPNYGLGSPEGWFTLIIAPDAK